MTRTLVRSLVVSCSVLAAATPALAAADAFAEGQAARVRGDHAAAVAAFERDLEASGWSVGALLELGRSQAALGEHGRAILAFERARLLAPRDAEIADQLAASRAAAGIASPQPGWWQRAVGTLPSDTWTWLALGGFAIACGGIVGHAWTQRRHLAWTAAAAGTVITVAASGAALRVAPDPDTAIIVRTASARVAPIEAADRAFSAIPGQTVEIVQRRGEQVYVRTPDAQVGWLPMSAVEPVLPQAGSGPATASSSSDDQPPSQS